MSDTVVELNKDEQSEKKLVTETWRVLKGDENTVETVVRWDELEPISGEGQFGYYISASDLGERHGEGDYILIRDGDGYATCRTLTIIADRYFHEKSDDDQ